MRHNLPWLVGFALLLLSLPATAQTATPVVPPPPEAGASCSAGVDLALLSGASNISLPKEIGLPDPIPLACESNFCSLERGRCETTCSPCAFDFSCRGRTCESTCTCQC